MADSQTHWHLEKSVSLSHIISTITLFLMLAGGYATMAERLAVLESQQQESTQRILNLMEYQRITDTRQDSQVSEVRRQTREDLQIINAKLDELIMELRK